MADKLVFIVLNGIYLCEFWYSTLRIITAAVISIFAIKLKRDSMLSRFNEIVLLIFSAVMIVDAIAALVYYLVSLGYKKSQMESD